MGLSNLISNTVNRHVNLNCVIASFMKTKIELKWKLKQASFFDCLISKVWCLLVTQTLQKILDINDLVTNSPLGWHLIVSKKIVFSITFMNEMSNFQLLGFQITGQYSHKIIFTLYTIYTTWILFWLFFMYEVYIDILEISRSTFFIESFPHDQELCFFKKKDRENPWQYLFHGSLGWMIKNYKSSQWPEISGVERSWKSI